MTIRTSVNKVEKNDVSNISLKTFWNENDPYVYKKCELTMIKPMTPASPQMPVDS